MNKYQVLRSGHIMNVDTMRVLKPSDNGHGYQHVVLRIAGQSLDFYIHRLVAEEFLPNPLGLPEVNHIDKDKTNNAVENLEWVSSKDNKLHFWKGRSRPVCCYDPITDRNEFFDSASEAAKVFGISSKCIRKACKGKLKTYYGYEWEYV